MRGVERGTCLILAAGLLGVGQGSAAAADPAPLPVPVFEVSATDGRLTVDAAAPRAGGNRIDVTSWTFIIDGPADCTAGKWQPGDPVPAPSAGCAVVPASATPSRTFAGLSGNTEYRIRAAYRAAPDGVEQTSEFAVATPLVARKGRGLDVASRSPLGPLPPGTAVVGGESTLRASFASRPQDPSTDDPLEYAWDFDSDGAADVVGGRTVSRRFPRVRLVPVTVTARSGQFAVTRHLEVAVVPAPNAATNGLAADPESARTLPTQPGTYYVSGREIDIRPTWSPATAATRIRVGTNPYLLGGRTLPLGHYVRWWLADPGTDHVLYAQYVDSYGAVVADGLELRVVVYDTAPEVSSAKVTRAGTLRLRMAERRRCTLLQVKYRSGRKRTVALDGAVPPSRLAVRQPRKARWIRLEDVAGNLGAWQTIRRPEKRKGSGD